jgi:hypothetical protein
VYSRFGVYSSSDCRVSIKTSSHFVCSITALPNLPVDIGFLLVVLEGQKRHLWQYYEACPEIKVISRVRR